MTNAFTATHIDISDKPARSSFPESWSVEIREAVETGRISYRRAAKLAAEARA